jgi:predicted secreted protein
MHLSDAEMQRKGDFAPTFEQAHPGGCAIRCETLLIFAPMNNGFIMTPQGEAMSDDPHQDLPQTLPQAQATPAQKKKLFPTALAATLFALCLSLPNAGFMLVLFALPLLILVVVSLVHMMLRPETRKFHLARIVIWATACALVVGVHYVRHVVTRSYANEVVAKIKHFSATQGRCPKDLEEMGIAPQEFREKLGMADYQCADDTPRFFYPAPYIIFDTYHYDFEDDVWNYITS